MVAHGAGGDADLAAILQLSRDGLAGSSPAGDDIEGELLDQLGFDLRTHAVVFLLADAFVEQSENIAFSQPPGHSCGVGRGIAEQVGYL